MALIRCPDCTREVSDKAPACIHCGCPLEPAPPPPPDAPRKRLSLPVHRVLSVCGGLLLAAGLVCLMADRTGWAVTALGAGLASTLAGGVWNWTAGR